MNPSDASAAMRAHYEEHKCRDDGIDVGCAVARENYIRYLTALAEQHGLHPQSFPSVRTFMRAKGEKLIPIEETWWGLGASR